MNAIQWKRVSELFDELLQLPREQRASVLQSETQNDPELRNEVDSLLQAHDRVGTRFDRAVIHALSADDLFPHPTTALPVGTQLGPWSIVRQIGIGGMGTVYEARRNDAEYEQRVAIKTIGRGALDSVLARRFRQERQILAGLQHSRIAALIDGGQTADGVPYLVMEYVDGQPINRYCSERKLGINARLDLFQQVGDAIEYAHRRLVVHRDLKPSNILVTPDGAVKVVDFGIAKLLSGANNDDEQTQDGLTPLTTGYASPEQTRGETITTATDVYSLGVVLYRSLSGAAPLHLENLSLADRLVVLRDTTPRLMSETCTDAHAQLCGLGSRARLQRALAGELDSIVQMALRAEPERRYPSVAAFVEDVRRYLRGLPVLAKPDTLGYRVHSFVRRRRSLVASGAFAVLAIVTGSLATAWNAHEARLEAARSDRVAGFLQTMLGAADATLGGSPFGVGPRSTVEMLLDSAVQRVPREFANDARVRARLYTAIGSSYLTRSRFREGFDILDSAARLALAEFGSRSPVYLTALLEGSNAAVQRNMMADAERRVRSVLDAIPPGVSRFNELRGRAMRDLATVHMVRGEYTAGDSAAREAIRLDRLGNGPTVVTPAAMNRLAGSLFAQGNLAAADTMLRHALALMDTLGVPPTDERLEMLASLSWIRQSLGRTVQAESLAVLGNQLAMDVMGPDSREVAMFRASRAGLKLERGDAVGARALVDSALLVVEALPEVSVIFRNSIRATLLRLLAVQGRWNEVDSVAGVMWRDYQVVNNAWASTFVLHAQGEARLRQRNGAAAIDALERALASYKLSEHQRPEQLQGMTFALGVAYAYGGRYADAERTAQGLPERSQSRLKIVADSARRAQAVH